MKSETITKEKLSGSIAEKIDIPHNHSRKVLEKILEIMIKALVRDGQLKISSFGTFMILNKGKRVGRNPKTGQEVIVTPRKSVSFRASEKLKHKIAKN
jgi:integration host factor subunit alpha